MSQFSSGAAAARVPKAAPDVREGSPAPRPHGCRLDSRMLLAGGVEVVIDHGGETYRLRLTRQNRLILTK